MRTSSLQTLLKGLVASVVPLVSWSACGDENENCYGAEGQETTYVTVSSSGEFVGRSNTPPDLGDASAGAYPDDAGADGGSDDCSFHCRYASLGDCTGFELHGCSTLARTISETVVRCDIDTHVMCLPKGAICGRRPAGLLPNPSGADRGGSPVGGLLSNMARLEAASVVAFGVLARELEALGAPESLARAARKAAADEVRHARVMKSLAGRHGAKPRKARVARAQVRSLFDVALENCVEGCVRETFGALVATWQAREARDPEIRRAMRSIAEDERRHAALAFRVAAWASARLDRTENRRIEEARCRALSDLRREFAQPPAPELVALAGLPDRRDAIRLIDAMSRVVWPGRREPKTSREAS